jgi:mRNA interferase MazF
MARTLKRGDICLYDFKKPDKKRPVVVLTRDDVIPLPNTVMVAPILSSIYGIPSEVVVGIEHGLKSTSAINLDHVQTVDKGRLTSFIAHLDETIMDDVCKALANAINCRIA